MVLRSRTHNPALMSLAFASGSARIRLDGDTVVVTVGWTVSSRYHGAGRTGAVGIVHGAADACLTGWRRLLAVEGPGSAPASASRSEGSRRG